MIRPLISAVCRVGWIVAEQIVFDQLPQRIDAEAVDAAIQPEAQHVEHGRLDPRMAPVEVGLLLEIGMVVVLAAAGIPFPGAAAKDADPVIRPPAIRRRVTPDVPVTLRAMARRA